MKHLFMKPDLDQAFFFIYFQGIQASDLYFCTGFKSGSHPANNLLSDTWLTDRSLFFYTAGLNRLFKSSWLKQNTFLQPVELPHH